MAFNLRARATLNTTGYIAGLNRIKAANAALNVSTVASQGKELSNTQKIIKSKEAAAAATVAATQANARAAQQATAAQAASARATASMSSGLNSQRYLYHDLSRQAMAAATAIGLLPVAAIAAGVSWQRDFADVVRTADPNFSNSAAAVENLRLSMVNMVQSMPASWGDVTEIATLANQMGIASSETASFTRTVAMFSATSGVSVDVVATAFGRLNSIVKLSEGGFAGLADSILKVGVNSVATEAEIINIVTQISSIAGAAGFTDKQMIGLAGSMASVRVPPELSRGVITRVFGQISRATTSGGVALEGFARIAGMSSDDFRSSWGTEGEAGEAFISFMNGIKEMGPQAEAALRSLGITSVRDVPVLLRLGSARDSEGVVGGLLRQTFTDAHDAAGETQRQYTIMADTVAAKLKVVGNNLMAFFSGVGASSLGPLGDVLDTISGKLADLTNSLDDNAVLFNKFKLPISNSELLGWGVGLGLAAAGVLALGSAVLKIKAASVGLQSLGGVLMGGTAGVGRVGQQWLALPGQINRATGAVVGFAARTASTMASSRNSMMVPGVAMLKAEAAAARATTAVTRGFATMRTAATVAAGAMGRAASFAFGPWGLAIGAAIFGINALVERTRAATTDISDLALELTRPIDSIKTLENITIGGLFGQESKPFADGARTIAEYHDQLKDLSNTISKESGGGGFSLFGSSGGGEFSDDGLMAMKAGKKAAEDWAAGLKLYDGAFQEMVNAGNGDAAARDLAKFAGSSKNLMNILASPEAKNMRRYYDSVFDMAGLKTSAANLEKLSRGQLPEVRAAMLGVEGAVSLTDAALEDFDGGSEAWAAVAQKAEGAAKSMIDFKAAAEAATDGKNFSLDKYNEELEAFIKSQEQWNANLGVAGRVGGSEFVDALLKIGPEDGARVIQEIVAGMDANGGKLTEAGRRTMENIIKGSTAGSAALEVEFGLFRDRLVSAFGDAKLVDALAEKLTPDEFAVFSSALDTVGKDAVKSLAEGIASESISVEEAIASLVLQNAAVLDVDFDLTTAQLSLATLVGVANGTITHMQLDALPDLALGAIWQVVETANGETGFVQVGAETGLALQDVAHVVDKAGRVVTVPLSAEDKEAIAAIDAVGKHASRTPAKISVTAIDNASTNIDWWARPRYTTLTVQEIVQSDAKWGRPSASGGMADGGLVSYYANGGINSKHVAQVAPAGAMRVWAEPETEGEAYIPFARSKRTRSLAILEQVAERFGYGLTSGTNVAKFADGGMYNTQVTDRQMRRYTNTMPNNASGINIGGVTFTNQEQIDQFREFTRYVNRIARKRR